MFKNLNHSLAFILIVGMLFGNVESAIAGKKGIIAINIALMPDAAMAERAEADNARLLTSYPKGFALDATHRPHITVLQRYVSAENLQKIYAAIDKVIEGNKFGNWRLKASNYSFSAWDASFIGSIQVEPTDDLLKLQENLISAIAPFSEKMGDADAFFTTSQEPNISQATIDYVAAFVPDKTGKQYNPHITIGFAPKDTFKESLNYLPFFKPG